MLHGTRLACGSVHNTHSCPSAFSPQPGLISSGMHNRTAARNCVPHGKHQYDNSQCLKLRYPVTVTACRATSCHRVQPHCHALQILRALYGMRKGRAGNAVGLFKDGATRNSDSADMHEMLGELQAATDPAGAALKLPPCLGSGWCLLVLKVPVTIRCLPVKAFLCTRFVVPLPVQSSAASLCHRDLHS